MSNVNPYPKQSGAFLKKSKKKKKEKNTSKRKDNDNGRTACKPLY